jgi:arylsulfatase A-like enzyme
VVPRDAEKAEATVTNRLRCVLVAVLAAVSVSAARGVEAVGVQERPNVLFIAVDDLRPELGCYGVKEIQSPNIDRLAASGVSFRRAYCQQAVCNPSRASLMTGLRPDTIKVWDLVTDFRAAKPDAVTIPQHFRAHGYRAVAFGKIYHNTMPDDVSWDEPTHNPKDVERRSAANIKRLSEFKEQMKAQGKRPAQIERMRGPATERQEVEDERTLDGKQARDAIAKMQELSKGSSPFFLAVGFIRPHLPFVAPAKYWDLYDREKLPLAANGFRPRGSPLVAFGDRSYGGFYELMGYMDYAGVQTPLEGPLSEAQQRELKHGYYASVSFIDAQVGLLLAELDRLDLARNTIVVLWGDHGWKLGEHGGWCKQTNYEIDTNAPLMIRAPGAKSNGTQTRALVEFVDLYPTLCELAGLPVPAAMQGTSLAPLLSGAASKVKEAAYSQFPRKHEGREYMGYAVRTERYRYIEWVETSTSQIAARELYDHEHDPSENENIADAAANAAVVGELGGVLRKGFDIKATSAK